MNEFERRTEESYEMMRSGHHLAAFIIHSAIELTEAKSAAAVTTAVSLIIYGIEKLREELAAKEAG